MRTKNSSVSFSLGLSFPNVDVGVSERMRGEEFLLQCSKSAVAFFSSLCCCCFWLVSACARTRASMEQA